MSSLGQQFRAQQVALSRQTLQSLVGLWPILDAKALDVTFQAWALAVSHLVDSRRAVSTSLAVSYLAAARFAAGVPGRGPSVPAGPVDPVQLATSLRVTGPVAVKRSMVAGKPLPQAMNDAFVQSSGAATRAVLAGGRGTVMQSLEADPQVTHMKRVTRPGACAFCAMLASRGPVYKTAETAGALHDYHDHCNCVIEPVYGHFQALDPQAQAYRAQWNEATHGKSGAAALAAFRQSLS